MPSELERHAPHVAKALQYAEDVLAGDIVAGVLTKQACQRFLDDLNRAGFEFHFDTEAAEKPCRFIETLPHIKGEWAKRGELLVLEGWQCFIVCNLFGWLDEDGLRRFKTAYVDVARKNAKSTLASAIALYMLCEDGEAGAEPWSCRWRCGSTTSAT
jgi:phage terminase large subunit-like protein